MTANSVQLQHASKGVASFTHEGVSFECDEDGVIALPSHIASHAKAHGFEALEAKKPARVLAKLTKGVDASDDADGDEKSDMETVKPTQKNGKAGKGGAE